MPSTNLNLIQKMKSASMHKFRHYEDIFTNEIETKTMVKSAMNKIKCCRLRNVLQCHFSNKSIVISIWLPCCILIDIDNYWLFSELVVEIMSHRISRRLWIKISDEIRRLSSIHRQKYASNYEHVATNVFWPESTHTSIERGEGREFGKGRVWR